MKLNRKSYPSVGEKVLEITLSSGLKVILLAKNDYHETYALMTSRFGSVDKKFTDFEGLERNYPAGIAHFLEHKIFEDENGQDYLEKFTKLGVESNAFTSFTRTSYLFSLTDREQLLPSLDLLFQMLANLHVTDESVEREKGIIKQEILMYQDQADDRLYHSCLSHLYPSTALAYDIAGSVDSMEEINKTDLLENFSSFYGPANMALVLVGAFDEEEILAYLSKWDGDALTGQSRPDLAVLDLQPVVDGQSLRMDISTPKLAIGLRGHLSLSRETAFYYKVVLKLLFSMLFGWTSKRFQELYETGKIDHSLSMEVEVEENFQFLILTMDTVEPLSLSHQLRQAIKDFEGDPDVTEEHLDTLKKEMFGDFIHALNSLEFLASDYDPFLEGRNLFDLPQLLQGIHLQDLIKLGHSFIDEADMIDFTIFPK